MQNIWPDTYSDYNAFWGGPCPCPAREHLWARTCPSLMGVNMHVGIVRCPQRGRRTGRAPLNPFFFFGSPNIIAGLHGLANFDTMTPYGVIAPSGTACDSIVGFPMQQLESDQPKAVLGALDPSVRIRFKPDILTFPAPWPKFLSMLENMDESGRIYKLGGSLSLSRGTCENSPAIRSTELTPKSHAEALPGRTCMILSSPAGTTEPIETQWNIPAVPMGLPQLINTPDESFLATDSWSNVKSRF